MKWASVYATWEPEDASSLLEERIKIAAKEVNSVRL
jgi:hypothetical protein